MWWQQTGLSRFQETTLFAKEYERCAEKVLRDVAHRSPSVEQYVKSTFAEYATSDREKYDQLVLSGLTADKLLKAYDGKSKEDVYADDAIELHLYNIAQEEYVQRTGNIVGARAVNGVQSFLLPQSVCELSQLVSLDLSDNRLAELPLQIVQLSRLTRLALSVGSLRDVSEWWTKRYRARRSVHSSKTWSQSCSAGWRLHIVLEHNLKLSFPDRFACKGVDAAQQHSRTGNSGD